MVVQNGTHQPQRGVIAPQPISNVQQGNAIRRSLQPYTVLPPRGKDLDGEQIERYVAAMPDTLVALIRQFMNNALDLGRLGFDDPRRFDVFRKKIFDARDDIEGQLGLWLEIWGVNDVSGQMRASVKQALAKD